MAAHLITGGARSGKTAFAERLARESGLPTVYIATANVNDAEMAARVERHRKTRPAQWRTIEAGSALAAALESEATAGACVIVDCVTLWLAGWLATTGDAPDAAQIERLEAERNHLVDAIARSPAEILVVTNELGSGVTPMGRLTRVFVDEHGFTNQRIAQACDRVTLMVAGCPMAVKSGITPGASHRAS